MAKFGRRGGLKAWFVDPYKQIKLGLIFLLLNLFFALAIFGVFGYYLWDIYSSVTTYFELSGVESSNILLKLSVPATVGAILLSIFIILTLLISVRYTYRIYGPLISIHRYLDDILAGEQTSPLVLRNKDELKTLAQKLNTLVETRIAVNPNASSALLPIYRHLDQLLADENPPPLTLRGDDRLEAFADKINLLVQKLG